MKKLLMFNPYSSISFSYSPSFLPSLTFYAILLWLRSKIFKYFKYVFVAERHGEVRSRYEREGSTKEGES